MNEKKENILDKLIEMGLSAEEIQNTYERYTWHLNKIETLESTLTEVLKVVEPMVRDWTTCPSCKNSWHNHDFDCALNIAVKKAKSVLPK